MAKILSALLLVLWAASPLYCDEASARKQELDKVKSETAQKEKELQKYRDRERKISKEISDLETQKAQKQKQREKLASDISHVQLHLMSAEEKRAALERSAPLWDSALEDALRAYTLQVPCAYYEGGYSLEEDLLLSRMAAQDAVFLAGLQRETQGVGRQLDEFNARSRALQEQNLQVVHEQEAISQSFAHKQKDLDSTKKQVSAVRKEIDDLKKSAKALNKLLAEFERKRKEAEKQQAAQAKGKGKGKGKQAVVEIPVPRHSLAWPVDGKIISSFGKEFREDLNTWIFRDGIKIAAKRGEAVGAVAEGSVIFAGPFRSYGNVVILDHGKGFFTIYGFLDEISAKVGDKLAVGGQVGRAGRDTQASSGTGKSAVYFEIRQGTAAVDPKDWLIKK